MAVDGAKAAFRGSGTLNGSAGYVFTISLLDGQVTGGVDKVRVTIWNDITGAVIYDNQPGALVSADPTMQIEGGSIVIHK